MKTLLLLLAGAAAWAQQYEMTTYHLVLLRKGPSWTGESTPQTRKIQEGHMANIHKMAATGKLTVAGPIAGDHDLRGIFIFTAASPEEVKAWCAEDPAVKAGRLVVEVYPWMAAKGLKVDPPK
jgi:uncharacterized protein YciI